MEIILKVDLGFRSRCNLSQLLTDYGRRRITKAHHFTMQQVSYEV